MSKDKSEAMRDFVNMIQKSWTYDRMTDKERANCIEAIQFCHDTCLSGTYEQRWKQLQGIYHAFLMGIGYDGYSWRK